MSTHQHYSRLNILFHWVMVALLIAVYTCVLAHEAFPKDSEPRQLLMSLHFMLGVSVLFLVIFRIIAILVLPTPPIEPAPPKLQYAAARVIHVALYLFMLAMPMAGWLMLNGFGSAVPFYGLELPILMGENEALAKDIKEVHETVGEAFYYVIGLHAIAALFHHYVLRDNTLSRMLPWVKARQRS
ncbi:Cytochrome b561 like protein [Saliniradius amylolyticus]|uniref:Cytochrome b561 like protein n=1 Tax=Saliniradius amylolyticus TaxID=2183582 RepID=A0A2S2E4L6_9ALTE|nr:cytochrome b [Saliniradius amylolyticus]AWL12190.1 Cytochrome b561 like protein [Saliniradius amylolyticus]